MAVHFIHDLRRESLIRPYAPVGAVCGVELREAHEIVAPESEADVCPECVSWAKRNRYQDRRCAVEMSAAGARPAGEGTRKQSPNSSETDA
jgi:ribosome-binding protein aMBF1 (putative translation factor)